MMGRLTVLAICVLLTAAPPAAAQQTVADIIDFLVSRSRSFIEESGTSHDPRKVAIVRPGLPEPSIAKPSDQSTPSNRGRQAASH